MVKKIIGYVLALIGILVLLLSFPNVRTTLKLTLPTALTDTTLLIASLVLVVIGVLFIGTGKKKEKTAEVPIYEGKDLVGFRRVKNK